MKKKYIKKINKKLLRVVKFIGNCADEIGINAYIVGGIVRDLILGIPNLDLDIIVDSNGILFAKYISEKINVGYKKFNKFGTAKLIFPNNMVVDIAGCRKEKYARPGNLPLVSSGSLIDDIKRRDFTINTLAISINSKTFGHFIDLFGGIEDISARKIRVLHNHSFQDDPTRILRAIRFEQRLNFFIDKKTYDLMYFVLKKKFVNNVNPQRYFTEFKKILLENKPEKALKRLYEFGGFDFIDKDINLNVKQLSKITSSIKNISGKNRHIMLDVEKWMLYFLSIMDCIDLKKRLNIAVEFGLASKNRKSIIQLGLAEDVNKKLSVSRVKDSQIYCLLRPLNKDSLVFIMFTTNKSIVKNRILEYLDRLSNIEIIINGNDIKKFFKVPDREIGRLLKKLLYAKLDNHFNRKSEEIKYVRNFLRETQQGEKYGKDREGKPTIKKRSR